MSYKATKSGFVCPISWPRYFLSMFVVLLTFCIVTSEMTYNVLMGTLNPTHSVTDSLTHSMDCVVL